MALSPAHRFGQITGEVLEMAVGPLLQRFADAHGLYLDRKGPRPARSGQKVRWTDLNGNRHDLDFVLEVGGTATERCTPVAFIETAWRRYTRHSRNKAQEIQGAIMPLAATHHNSAPSLARSWQVCLRPVRSPSCGHWVSPSCSSPYALVVDAFALVGIDASFNESTPVAEFDEKVRSWDALTYTEKRRVASALIDSHPEQVANFIEALRRSITRKIESVRILPLHGSPFQAVSLEEALAFLDAYSEAHVDEPLVRYEVEIRYVNGEVISGRFNDRAAAILHLHIYLRPPT